jgi:hypothetical protein
MLLGIKFDNICNATKSRKMRSDGILDDSIKYSIN